MHALCHPNTQKITNLEFELSGKTIYLNSTYSKPMYPRQCERHTPFTERIWSHRQRYCLWR